MKYLEGIFASLHLNKAWWEGKGDVVSLTHAEAPVLRFLGVLQQLPHEGLVVSELGLHAHAFPPTCAAPPNKQKTKKKGKKEKKIATTFQQLGGNRWSGKQVICRRPVSAALGRGTP